MDYVSLGAAGLKISRICLGCMTYGEPGRGTHEWTLPEAESRPFIARAHRGAEDADRAIIDAVARIAGSRGVPMAQIAMAWLLAKPGVTAPIAGASKPNHLEDAVAALSIKLTVDEISAIESPYVPRRVAGF